MVGNVQQYIGTVFGSLLENSPYSRTNWDDTAPKQSIRKVVANGPTSTNIVIRERRSSEDLLQK